MYLVYKTKMKNKNLVIILFLAVAFVAGFSILSNRNASESIKTDVSSSSLSSTINLEDFEKALKAIRPKPSAAIRDEILNYIENSTGEEIKKAFNLLLEKDLDKKLSKAKKTISSINIDGDISEWESSGLIQNDKKNDPLATDASYEIGNFEKKDDIKSYAFIMNNNYIYGMIEPYEMPEDYYNYYFRISLLNFENKLIYTFVWTDDGNFIQQWDTDTGENIDNLDVSIAEFTKGENGFEVKVPISKIKNNLPYSFGVEAVSWQEDKNTYDSAYNLFYEQSVYEKYKKAALELLTKYAAKIELTPDDIFPAVQAISDSYIYKRSDTSTKKLVITDGLEMLEKAEDTENYSFTDQKQLKDMPLEALLAWADRGMTYVGHYSEWLYPAKGEKLNKETYEFMILQPETLDLCENLIEENDLLDPSSLANTVKDIELWVTNIEEYRRIPTDMATLEIATAMDPENEWLNDLYEENISDIENGNTTITTVNGIEISKGGNFSPSFQIEYLSDNGFFYGNCVGVATVTSACYKSLGIPSIHFSYEVLGDDFRTGVHIFPMHYSSKDDKWYPYELGGNTVHEWAKPSSDEEYNILYLINRPQTSSYWEPLFTRLKEGKVDFWYNSRFYQKEVTEKVWKKLDQTGYSMKDLKSIFFK